MYNPITVIKVKDVTLSVVYNKTCSGLYEFFSIDDRMHQFLNSNTNEALLSSINKIDDQNYIINIASTMNLGAFEWKNEKDLLDRQLSAFMPIIEKFIVGVLTDSLEL